MTQLAAELYEADTITPPKANAISRAEQSTQTSVSSLVFSLDAGPSQQALLTDGVKCLLKGLSKQFAPQVQQLLPLRKHKHQHAASEASLDFLAETTAIRNGDWQIRSVSEELQDRRVELGSPISITSNSGAQGKTGEFGDGQSWNEIIQAHTYLRSLVSRSLDSNVEQPLGNKVSAFTCKVSHLDLYLQHVEYDGKAIPAALFDFCVYFYSNYRQLLSNGFAPHFYIPRIENHLEARWWASVFAFVEARFCLQPGAIKCTCGIETIAAAFEMDEILYELRSNIVALSCGDLDTKTEAAQQQMSSQFNDCRFNSSDKSLTAYARLLIKTCHKRGALALVDMESGWLVEQATVDEQALNKLTSHLELAARSGFDGVQISNMQLAEPAVSIFNRFIGVDNNNQLHITRDVDAPIHAKELLASIV